jgi:hypothetical protein
VFIFSFEDKAKLGAGTIGANKVLSEKGMSFVINTSAITIDVMLLKAQRHVRPTHFAPDNIVTK